MWAVTTWMTGCRPRQRWPGDRQGDGHLERAGLRTPEILFALALVVVVARGGGLPIAHSFGRGHLVCNI